MSKKIGFSYCPKVGGHNLLIGVALQCHQNQNVEHVESKQLGGGGDGQRAVSRSTTGTDLALSLPRAPSVGTPARPPPPAGGDPAGRRGRRGAGGGRGAPGRRPRPPPGPGRRPGVTGSAAWRPAWARRATAGPASVAAGGRPWAAPPSSGRRRPPASLAARAGPASAAGRTAAAGR